MPLRALPAMVGHCVCRPRWTGRSTVPRAVPEPGCRAVRACSPSSPPAQVVLLVLSATWSLPFPLESEPPALAAEVAQLVLVFVMPEVVLVAGAVEEVHGPGGHGE